MNFWKLVVVYLLFFYSFLMSKMRLLQSTNAKHGTANVIFNRVFVKLSIQVILVGQVLFLRIADNGI